jgi:predicted RNA polymerase sigma factor
MSNESEIVASLIAAHDESYQNGQACERAQCLVAKDFPPYTKKPGTKYVVAANQSVVTRALALYDRDWTKIEDLGEVLIIEDIRAPSGADIVPDIEMRTKNET